MEGTINGAGQVEKVRTWIDQPIVGRHADRDHVLPDYKDVGGGVNRPTHLVVTQDGFPSLDLTISSVTINPAADITVPDNVKAFQPPPLSVTADKLANGVFYPQGAARTTASPSRWRTTSSSSIRRTTRRERKRYSRRPRKSFPTNPSATW